ncbi:MAG: acyl-CoA/acyl-ACP dehydrogenase [Dehalococcoidia bacterium]|nr:acyl-CoA/acyl-ACP dehydrogenase [Dehalococcoidia bacterium]
MLELTYSEEEAFIQRSAREFLKEAAPVLKARDVERSPMGYDLVVWSQIQELGWDGMPFSSEVGGAETGMVAVAVVAEELGRACYPGPLRAVWAYGLLLEALGDRDRLRQLISGRPSQRIVGVPALWEKAAPYDPTGTTAQLTADGALVGEKVLVAYANAASRLLVLARDPGGTLRFAEVESDAVTLIDTPTSSGDKLFAVRLDGARPIHVYDADAQETLARVTNKIIAIECAWMLGLAAKAFELSVDYVKGRVQFGRPIGSFQAVQHKIVDVGIAVESARFLVYRAAWTTENAPDEADLAVHYAKAHLNGVTDDIIKETFQVHGAMGMTWEYDLQLANRRLKAASLAYGDAHYHRDRVLAALGV